MKMKMKVVRKNEYGIGTRDINAINRANQANVPQSSKSKDNHNKKQAATVASWFSPQKYAGFKSNFK